MLLEEDRCPVSLETLGLLYGLPQGQIAGAISELAPKTRAQLSLYCVQRSHLRAIGISIAASCDYSDLYAIGGKAGTALYEISREQRDPQHEEAPRRTRSRPKITLATKAA